MALNKESHEEVVHLAEEVLEKLHSTSELASRQLSELVALGPNALVSVNTMAGDQTLRNLQRVGAENRVSLEQLTREPSIARVIARDESGKVHIYYFCRSDQGLPNIGVVSYRAKIGRLASLPVGEDFTSPNGQKLEVIERALLRPFSTEDGWDSRDTRFETGDIGPITVVSLRALIPEEKGIEEVSDVLAEILAADSEAKNIFEGVRRGVRTKMVLRDQPVLDRYQDAIFRLPIDSRLLLLGPPGTGKTTTLIRRLGQKLDVATLDDAERAVIESLGRADGVPHRDSWIMFTPTELLQKYLKEAFSREGVAAPDARIRTWADVRRELGREVFGLLRTENGGTFILRDALKNLKAEATDDSRTWYDDFAAFETRLFLDELRDSALRLANSGSDEVKDIAEKLARALEQDASASFSDIFEALAAAVPRVRSFLDTNKIVTDEKARRALNLQANRDKGFLDSLADFLTSLQASRSAEEEDSEDQDPEEDEDSLPSRMPRAVAASAYLRALRVKARALASRRAVPKGRNSEILDWLGTRVPTDIELEEMGRNLLMQASARRFADPVRRHRNEIPRRYRVFRRMRQLEGRWYSNAEVGSRDLHPLELDLILLRVLKISAELIAKPKIRGNVALAPWASLKPFSDQLRNQVFVDEATDFSFVQLACMASLAEPRLKSFFVCGDFNQRLTIWGTRSEEDLRAIFADLEIRRVNIGYRQSRRLIQFAHSLIGLLGGSEPGAILPEHTTDDGQSPALVENSQGEGLTTWLATRIRDIERLLGQLPTIAVFVNGEASVGPMAEHLGAKLSEHNIPVEACRDGKTVGQDNSVRVFDIQHIKGLEFESVFFVGIDTLALQEPKLFDRYLYVGTTRAATFLGLTCEKTLPTRLEPLRPQFVGRW